MLLDLLIFHFEIEQACRYIDAKCPYSCLNIHAKLQSILNDNFEKP